MAVTWKGERIPAEVAAALRAQKLAVRSGPPDLENPRSIGIAFTDTDREVPSPAGPPGRWLWLVGGVAREDRAVEAVRAGAYDVISLVSGDGVGVLSARLNELQAALPEPPASANLVLASAASRRVVLDVARAAGTSMAVLLTGETGTGKEVMGRLIHQWSARRARPFVPINCSAIPNDLMEAELFGYARGAFSGAVQRYDGQLMAAEGGTVFLDEIHETPPETQVKLLRVLEDRVVSRLGENVWHEVDFRLVAATNRDLRTLIDAGQFGADLYERLAIVRIDLIPLRERLEDLPALAAHFMARFAREERREPMRGIRPDALRLLQAYPWPGNIRELRNVMFETLVYKRSGHEVMPSDLPKRILRTSGEAAAEAVAGRSMIAHKIARGTMSLRGEVAALQRMALEEALKRAHGNAAEAARLLGEVGRGSARDPGGTVRAMRRRLGPG